MLNIVIEIKKGIIAVILSLKRRDAKLPICFFYLSTHQNAPELKNPRRSKTKLTITIIVYSKTVNDRGIQKDNYDLLAKLYWYLIQYYDSIDRHASTN